MMNRSLHAFRGFRGNVLKQTRRMSTGGTYPMPFNTRSLGIGLAVSGSLLAYLALSPGRVVLLEEHHSNELPEFHNSDIIKHTSKDDAWIVYEGIVYDVTKFLDAHPAGFEVILEQAGKDVTKLFKHLHAAGTFERAIKQFTIVGKVHEHAIVHEAVLAADLEIIDERRDDLPPLETVLNISEFEEYARYVLGEDSRAWRYFSSWCDDGATYDITRNSFKYVRFIPRVNVPVEKVDTATVFLGQPVPVPFYVSPTGQNRQGHPEGELNVARACAEWGIVQGVSCGSSCSINEICDEMKDQVSEGRRGAPVWWQLYLQKDRAESKAQIENAVAAGSGAVFYTVDVASLGNREADSRGAVKGIVPGSGANKQKGGAKLDGGLASELANLFDADLHWRNIAWIASVAKRPVIVKGVACPEDVLLAKQNGAKGVVLSNHGGRQLEYAPAPLATLVRLYKTYPQLLKDPDFDVYIDGGITRGTDILKALCLGAKGVGLGRAAIYANACYGDEGVSKLFQILSKEIVTGMRLLGATKISELRPDMVEIMPGLVGEQLK